MAPRKIMVVEPSTRVTRSSSSLTKVVSESPKKKKAKKNPSKKKPVAEKPKADTPPPAATEEAAAAKEEEDGLANKTIIIEHCKQCRSFSRRALQVKNGLENGGKVKVVLNPEKPRKGCFEIREEGENGEIFISLLDMKRPFKPMKDLDIDQVIAEIIDKI